MMTINTIQLISLIVSSFSVGVSVAFILDSYLEYKDICDEEKRREARKTKADDVWK